MTDPAGIAVGLVLFASGAAGVRYAYSLTRRSEQFDSIGSSTGWHEVEPAGWRVTLTRLSSAGLALLGVGLAVAAWLGITNIA